ncbi:MAG TPA: S16 family serine protease [Candidatus Nanoarchaeia archaeon]|nr:S16 family serine protease [Candidatus Nanoarchaeia archaeon]
MRMLYLCLLFLLLSASFSFAKEGHLTLLAVKESDNGYEGTTADLYLELKPGTGRVFLDTFPLTKVDTQISTRFARDIACSYLDADCGKYDFVYTIRADSPIVAGPSAGGAITLLTISLLKGQTISDTISVTGTINSGGIIGPVGGIKEKLDAAAQAGLKKVLIPEGERLIEESFNGTNITTVDLVEYGKSKKLEVIEVSDINAAWSSFTGHKLEKDNYSLTIDQDYNLTMSYLAGQLCSRSKELMGEIDSRYSKNDSMLAAVNLTRKAETALGNGRYYSAASYCFGANVKLNYLLLSSRDFTKDEMRESSEVVLRNIKKLDESITRKEKKTVTDLEAFSVVKERLIEAEDFYKEINSTDVYNLAYSFERVYSAYSWASFFDNRGAKYDFNTELLRSSCQRKIEEAEERFNYVKIFHPVLGLEGTRKEIDYAYSDLRNQSYELCLFKATNAKAESDIILSVSGIGVDKLDNLLSRKISAAEKNIGKQIAKGNFPVLAFSYYEYAKELATYDPYSALLYAEYAIELSNLDMYFKKGKSFSFNLEMKPFVFLLIGLAFGYASAIVMRKRSINPSRAKNALLGKKR